MHTLRLGLLFRLEFGMKMTLREKVKGSSCPTEKLGVPGVCGRGLGGRQGPSCSHRAALSFATHRSKGSAHPLALPTLTT